MKINKFRLFLSIWAFVYNVLKIAPGFFGDVKRHGGYFRVGL